MYWQVKERRNEEDASNLGLPVGEKLCILGGCPSTSNAKMIYVCTPPNSMRPLKRMIIIEGKIMPKTTIAM
jgi:hypothetical protein